MNFGHELLEPKLDNIQDRLEIGFKRIPALEKAGIKNIVNGPFTFGPDGNPLIGPVPGKKNYWVAVGVMAGFCQAGGPPSVSQSVSPSSKNELRKVKFNDQVETKNSKGKLGKQQLKEVNEIEEEEEVELKLPPINYSTQLDGNLVITPVVRHSQTGT